MINDWNFSCFIVGVIGNVSFPFRPELHRKIKHLSLNHGGDKLYLLSELLLI